VGCSERRKEIRRRRHRTKKLGHFKKKVESATTSDKQAMANKIWHLTPGAAVVIKQLSIG
jgi:hypothetical protein